MERLLCSGKALLLNAVLMMWAFTAHTQDPVFSQFNLNKNYTNPAYAGYTEDFSLAVHARRQWTHVPGAFNTNTFVANVGCSPGRLGLAVLGYDHTEGEGYLNTKRLGAQVSVNIPGRVARWWGRKLSRNKFIWSAGLGLSTGQKTIDWSKLTFTDQYSAYEGYLGLPSKAHGYPETSNQIFTMNAGSRMQLELDDKGSFISAGMAMFHLNRPVETFFNVDNRLQPRYTAHLFAYLQTKKYSNKPSYLSLGMIMDHQQGTKTNTILSSKDVGSFAKLSLGWRRQNFLLIDKNVDAIILQTLATFGNFTLGYSYDITISQLGPHRTFGTHEIGLAYVIDGLSICSGRNKRRRKKSNDDCFMLMEDISPAFRDLYLWNP